VREVDLDAGESRPALRHALQSGAQRPLHPHEEKLLAMLSVLDHA
jgi:hypothetical protein